MLLGAAVRKKNKEEPSEEEGKELGRERTDSNSSSYVLKSSGEGSSKAGGS